MAYTVFARKYRPHIFGDLVGQDHVTRTLSNAIESERVAHAFLFTGVRGVGKTTTARILAKALNCEKGPTPEPCGTCDVCVDITAGRDTDVQEMDGASNNSVEDVRRLQESIPYRPTRDRFKIVIVDEVHMLSTGAFNAFLKTLEEPPPHVKFIFATTEAHKVPVTIRSRCQRYDFRLIPQTVVARRVREILANEGIAADDAAVEIVAREAAGSMRDALTLLDQIVAFAGDSIVGDEVARVLGIAERDVVHTIAAAVLEGEGATVLEQVDRLATNGLDMLHFTRQLLDLVRDMVVLQVAGSDSDLVMLVDEERKRALDAGGAVDIQELQRVFSGLSKVVEDVAQSGMPRTTLEMGLVRLATRPPLLRLAEIVARLDALDRRGGGGGGGGGRSPGRGGSQPGGGSGSQQASRASAAGSASPRAPAPQASSPHTADGRAPSAATSRAAAPAGPPMGAAPSSARDQAQNRGPQPTPNPQPNPGAKPSPTPSAKPTPSPQPAPSAKPNPQPNRGPQPAPATTAAPQATPRPKPTPSARPTPSAEPTARPSASAEAQADARPAAAEDALPGESSTARPAPRPAPSPMASPDEGSRPERPSPSASAAAPRSVTEAWSSIVSRVMDRKPALGAVLKHGAALEVGPERIVLGFPVGSFFGRQAAALNGSNEIASAAEAVFGRRPEVEVTEAGEALAANSIVEVEKRLQADRVAATRERALNHPMVLAAQELFGVPRPAMNVRVEME